MCNVSLWKGLTGVPTVVLTESGWPHFLLGRPIEIICLSCLGRKKCATAFRIAEQPSFPHEPHIAFYSGIFYKPENNIGKGHTLQNCILFKDAWKKKRKQLMKWWASQQNQNLNMYLNRGLAVVSNFCGFLAFWRKDCQKNRTPLHKVSKKTLLVTPKEKYSPY